VGWPQLAEACVAIQAGADWYATNADASLPSPRGLLPGNGALVAAVSTALGRGPDFVVGKPGPGLFVAAAERTGATRPLAVGDRLDTDIEGATRAGMDSVLVLTGVTTPRQLLIAPAERRPTYVATDLSGLFTWRPGGSTTAGRRVWLAAGPPGAPASGWSSPVRAYPQALLALCAAAWAVRRPRSWTSRPYNSLRSLSRSKVGATEIRRAANARAKLSRPSTSAIRSSLVVTG
jgi:hypothetical protein